VARVLTESRRAVKWEEGGREFCPEVATETENPEVLVGEAKAEQEAGRAEKSYRRKRVEKTALPFVWSRVYVESLRLSGNVAVACQAAKVSRGEVRDAMSKSEAFALACQDAVDEYADRLEAEADRRARVGWEEPVYQMGKLVGSKRVYDSRLMEKLLEGAKPAKYRPGMGGPAAALVFVERQGAALSEVEWARRHDPTKVMGPAGESEDGG
jgi:hypothetical protein